MATKQSTRSRSTSSSSARRAPATTPKPVFASAFEGHVADAWGLALVALGVLAGLGIYLDAAGALGRLIDGAAGGALGVARLLVPPALLVAGAVLIRNDVDDETSGVPVRGIVGSSLLLVGGTGLLHLGLGRPAIGDGLDGLAEAGGLLGAATGIPLEAFASIWGASLVLGTVTLLGVLVLTHTTVRAVAGTTAAGVRPLGQAGRNVVATLFSTPGPVRADQAAPAVDATTVTPTPS